MIFLIIFGILVGTLLMILADMHNFWPFIIGCTISLVSFITLAVILSTKPESIETPQRRCDKVCHPYKITHCDNDWVLCANSDTVIKLEKK